MAGEVERSHSGPIATTTAKQKEWLAIVHHYNAGNCRIRITAEAVSISEATGGVMVCSAPQWEICCYRKKDKLEWSTPLSKFHGINSANPLARNASKHRILQKTGMGKIAGMRCSEWTSKDNSGSKIWLSEDLQVAKQVPEAICRYFSMPIVDKVPVRSVMAPKGANVDIKKPSGSADQWLNAKDFADTIHSKDNRLAFDTKSISVVPYNPADFAKPKGFKHAASGFDVLFSKQQSNEIVERLDGIGFASSKPKRTEGKSK